ncbi:MinD/ParA family protein [Herpetosiphon gulosus]|uniref:Iron-sulfur cluster carrier protein n=1 Tax=Herpetosiphon gulosus TaxID=1973496 RepID=A0ABP9X037_9CHLR
MPKIVSIHSFRPGTGKSQLTANIATILAAAGQRVAIIDSDVHSPSIQWLFGLPEGAITHSLNDFLWGKCGIESTAVNLNPTVRHPLKGQLYLVPFATRNSTIDYDISLLSDSFELLINTLRLDALLIDTQPGVQFAALPSIAFSDIQVLVLQLREQDLQGTGVVIDISEQLGINEMVLIVNQIPEHYNLREVQQKIEQIYQRPVLAALPYDELLADYNQASLLLERTSSNIFVVEHPDHPISLLLTNVAATLTA